MLEASAAFYYENRVRWTDWLRTSVGFRQTATMPMSAPTPGEFGRARDGIVNPKLGRCSPWLDTSCT